jgi:steroid delta-isomerase-like uncharacterized protein
MPAAESLRRDREKVVREHMDSENRLDFAATLKTFAHPRYEIIPTSQVYDGPEEVMGYYRASRAAVPDQRNEIRAFHNAADAVIVEFDLLGTHTGVMQGLPPTGKSFRVPMIAVFQFDAGDRIICERVYFDTATFLRQLGLGGELPSAK